MTWNFPVSRGEARPMCMRKRGVLEIVKNTPVVYVLRMEDSVQYIRPYMVGRFNYMKDVRSTEHLDGVHQVPS